MPSNFRFNGAVKMIVTIAATLITLGGGVAVWNEWNLPRPALLQELNEVDREHLEKIEMVNERSKNNACRLIEIDLRDVRDRKTELIILQAQLDADGKDLPQTLKVKLEDYDWEIERLRELLEECMYASPGG